MEIKPCPFCGGESNVCKSDQFDDQYLMLVQCDECFSKGSEALTEVGAIILWNTRNG
jgi:Lar family restriction alleviation protein